jgi:prevent-host-death family protein
MRIANISEAKTHLSRLVEEVQSGKQVVISKGGKPMAVLSAYQADTTPRTPPGAWKGKVTIAEDFDELPESVLEAFEGEEE